MSVHILLVEDDQDACHILQNVLSKAGYAVHFFHDGRAILEKQFSVPDVFLLDNSMPSIDGVALCKYLRLKDETRNIPVIIMSGNHQIKPKADKAGANAFLPKPFQIEDLLKHVDTAVSSIRQVQFQNDTR